MSRPSALGFSPTAGPTGFDRRALIAGRPVPTTKAYSPERKALSQVGSARKRGSSGVKDCVRLAAAHFAKEQMPQRGFA
jgi:hypothetical protein